MTHAYSYDPLNPLTQMGASKNASAISNYAYTLGAAGNRTTVAELSGRTVNYAYDSLYRLTTEMVSADPHNNNGTASYTYDAVGNRKTLNTTTPPAGGMNYAYDADDRLAADQYDADGNTVNSLGTANIYDFENHMIAHGGVSIVYDGDGNRVSETVGVVTTQYLVDTQNPTGYAQVVDELQNGSVTKTYSYGLERVSQNWQLGTGNWQPSFYGYDGHGSVRQLTNSAGAVTDTYDYDAFGNLISSTGTTPNVYLFAGEAYDDALGLYYNRTRYLNTTTGRFWSADTDEGEDEDPLTLHKYLYANANPVDGVDPSGFQDNLAELGAEESMSITLDTMAFFQLGGLRTAKLGIGIEPIDPAAVQNNVLNVAVDTGHTFVYIRNLGVVTTMLSFGPGSQIGPNNIVQFLRGNLPGNAHWPLTGSTNTWEFPISTGQMNTAKQAISDFKAHVPNYTTTMQCTSAALSIATTAGVSLPSGVGPVIARESRTWRGHTVGVTLWHGDVANPYHLNKQMTEAQGAPTVVDTGTFPAP